MNTGLYQHFKGGFYWVLSISINRDGGQVIVNYIALNRAVIDDSPIVEHRTAEEFFGEVSITKETKAPRFKFVRAY